mgnify:CR=1 FL=1
MKDAQKDFESINNVQFESVPEWHKEAREKHEKALLLALLVEESPHLRNERKRRLREWEKMRKDMEERMYETFLRDGR